MKDVLGKALIDYQSGNYSEDIITETSISEQDTLPIPYLFRTYKEMPKIEQKALDLSIGKVLDVGCGAGSHLIYLQDKKNMEITGIDISKGAIDTCKLRGLKNVYLQNIMELKNSTFDTILMLMNGTGIFGQLKNVSLVLQHLKSLLTNKGQILIDSSDIIYMFDEDEDGGKWISTETDYYGEIEYTMSYRGEKTKPFYWLYLDFNTLNNLAVANGFNCKLIAKGDYYDYLAQLTISK